MITLVIGKQGAGKTLYLVRKAYYAHLNNKTIYSNFTLRIPYNPLTPDYFIDPKKSSTLKDCTILIDEGQAFFDCRRSTSALNLILNFFVAQTRKRNVEMYITTHNISFIDLRLRYHTTFFTFVKPLITVNKNLVAVDPSKLLILQKPPDAILATTLDNEGKTVMKELFNPYPFFKLYDTKEIIIPNWHQIAKNLNPKKTSRQN